MNVGIGQVILDSVPSLAISLSTNASTVTLAWPGPAIGFNLYSATNLPPSNLLGVTNAVTGQNGNMQVSLPFINTAGQRFFRLRPP